MRVPLLILPLLALAAATPSAAQDPITDAAVRFLVPVPGGGTTPPPQAYGGEECRVAITQVGAGRVWWGRFAGGYSNDGKRRGSSIRSYQREACFGSEGQCEAWMYMLKTRFSEKPGYNYCRLGYEPGAPLPAWWQTQGWRPPAPRY